jgi:hypothetical protein
LCGEIDERVRSFLERPIEGDWPYLWIDATYVMVREAARFVPVAVTIAVAVNTDGRREVLGMAIGASEPETFWIEFFRKLKRRGLAGVKLVISDAHEGIKAAVARVFRATWQRCRVGLLKKFGSCDPVLPDVVAGGEESSRCSSRRSVDSPSCSSLDRSVTCCQTTTSWVRVDYILDLGWLHEEVAELYDAGTGRPSIDPEVVLRLMLAGFLLGFVDDRTADARGQPRHPLGSAATACTRRCPTIRA